MVHTARVNYLFELELVISFIDKIMGNGFNHVFFNIAMAWFPRLGSLVL